jgi:DNA-binding protein H-NS
MATFDQQEQMLKGQMGGIKNDLTKLYEVEAAGVSQLGLDAQQLQRRYQQLQTKYKLAYAKQSSEFEPAIQEVTAKRQTAMAEVQAKFAATRIKQNTYQEMIDDGTITPEEGRKRQFAAMGVNYDSPDPPTPKERLAELRQYQTALTDVMLNTRRNKKGNIEEYMGSAGSPEWEVVPPDRAAEIEKTWQVNNGIVDEIERVATAAGVKMGLADTGRTAMAPAKKTGLAAIGNLIKRSPAAKAFEASGYRLQRPGLFRPMITRTPVAKPLTKELATELRNKGMTREQVEQWAKENGYAI